MKFNRLLLVLVPFGLLISSCSSGSTNTIITPGSGNTTTTITSILATSTTVAIGDCSQTALDAAVGGKTYTLGCSSDWAALQPASWECGEHCFAFIYKWETAKWNLRMKCSQYDRLTAEGWCEGMTGQISDGNYTGIVAEYPTNDVACKIWAGSVYGGDVEFKKTCA